MDRKELYKVEFLFFLRLMPHSNLIEGGARPPAEGVRPEEHEIYNYTNRPHVAFLIV